MGYTVPFQLVSGNATKAQQAANALVMGRNALDATVAKPAVKVQGFVSSPSVDTVEYRDQLYQAVEAVVTYPVSGVVRGNVSIVGNTKKQTIFAAILVPPNAYTIPVPFAVESRSSADVQELREELVLLGVLPTPSPTPSPVQQPQVTTLAGSGSWDYADGQGTSASFASPSGLAVDGNGNVYVADTLNHRIRKINASGTVSTLAGSGNSTYADGQGVSACFYGPFGLAIDGIGNLYVGDQYNYRIRKIMESGTVSTLAGRDYDNADGQGASASFIDPLGVAVDASGNVYVAAANRIRKITASGTVTTLAGSDFGYAEGQGASARFYGPIGIALDGSGNVYVADSGNHRIRKITASGTVTTLAGSGIKGYADGQGSSASFNNPTGVAVDGNGNVYVADSENHRIRKITPNGTVTTLAGSGTAGSTNGNLTTASFSSPTAVAVDGEGNVYVGEGAHRIRKITIPQ